MEICTMVCVFVVFIRPRSSGNWFWHLGGALNFKNIANTNMSAINFAAAAGNPFYMPQGPAGKRVADEQAITHAAQGPACEKNNFEEATIQGDARQALGLERAAAAEAACEVNNFACQDAK